MRAYACVYLYIHGGSNRSIYAYSMSMSINDRCGHIVIRMHVCTYARQYYMHLVRTHGTHIMNFTYACVLGM